MTMMTMTTFMVSTWTVMALAMAAGARSSLPPDRWLPSPEMRTYDIHLLADFGNNVLDVEKKISMPRMDVPTVDTDQSGFPPRSHAPSPPGGSETCAQLSKLDHLAGNRDM